jgi:hypothetical protein
VFSCSELFRLLVVAGSSSAEVHTPGVQVAWREGPLLLPRALGLIVAVAQKKKSREPQQNLAAGLIIKIQ